MPGNDAVLFFSETHVVEVKEIIMSVYSWQMLWEALWAAFLQSCSGEPRAALRKYMGRPEPRSHGWRPVRNARPAGRGPCFPVIQRSSPPGVKEAAGAVGGGTLI